MADRLPSFLTQPLLARVAVIVLVALAATAGLTYAAGSQLPSAPAVPTVSTAPAQPLVVPDVRNQAFVFAKGALEEAGFAWLVSGTVRGYSSNVVVSESPAPGTRVVDAGSPRITLVLKRGPYEQTGEPEDTSPYSATAVQPADLTGRAIGPAAPASAMPAAARTLTPAAKTPKTAAATATAATPATPGTPATAATPKTASKPDVAAKPAATAKWPQNRPAAFVVPGARKEPLNEMPLPDRAHALGTWLTAHPKPSNANVNYWLYQNAWVVVGAKLGWWHGAQALQTLIEVDQHTEKLWKIGTQSEAVARRVLSFVRAKSKS